MTEYVPIYVPEAHYRDMVGHLASLISQTRVVESKPETGSAPVEQSDAVWTDEVWEKVWSTLTDGSRTIMVLLAEHPGEWVPISALEDSLGSFRAVQSALSSLTKRLRKRGLDEWPIDVEIDGQSGRAHYRMDPTTAAVVLRLARA
jgi:hypothetical protein